MKKILILISSVVIIGNLTSCKKYLDINQDPDQIVQVKAPIDLLFSNATVNVGFANGSDLFRYPALFMQHFTGQSQGAIQQTQDYDKYNIQSADVNNVWSANYATILNDLESVINLAKTGGSPHYGGAAKLLKVYTYHHLVDAWGNIPYSETQQTSALTSPKYDDAATIYTNLLALIDEALVDLNQPTSALAPGASSFIYTGSWATKKANWIKFANTLKLRLLIHYSKIDPAGMVTKINTLVNATSTTFFASNSDNFEMPFFNVQNRQSPIHQFEISRPNYLFAAKFLVDNMNTTSDPRRVTYFTPFPATSTNYVGGVSGAPTSQNYSRMHTYLRGAVVTPGTPVATGASAGSYNPLPAQGGITYDGIGPVRMLTFAEYNFIRAEAAVRGAAGVAQTFFQAGITASMQSAGVSATDIATYIAANGTLSGSTTDMIRQIITEKYVANYGVMQEPWTDWRRTGFPAISIVPNAVTTNIPRSLPYPQSEADANQKFPGQKPNMDVRVFWDTP